MHRMPSWLDVRAWRQHAAPSRLHIKNHQPRAPKRPLEAVRCDERHIPPVRAPLRLQRPGRNLHLPPLVLPHRQLTPPTTPDIKQERPKLRVEQNLRTIGTPGHLKARPLTPLGVVQFAKSWPPTALSRVAICFSGRETDIGGYSPGVPDRYHPPPLLGRPAGLGRLVSRHLQRSPESPTPHRPGNLGVRWIPALRL